MRLTPLEEAVHIHRRVSNTYQTVFEEYCGLTGDGLLCVRAQPVFSSVADVLSETKRVIERIDELRKKIEHIRTTGKTELMELMELKELAEGYY